MAGKKRHGQRYGGAGRITPVNVPEATLPSDCHEFDKDSLKYVQSQYEQGMPLSRDGKRSLASLFDELVDLADQLIMSCRRGDWSRIDEMVPRVKSYVRSIKDEVPKGTANVPLRKLDTHAHFIEMYAGKKDTKYVLSNAHSIRPDLQRLRSALGVDKKDELRSVIEILPDGAERKLLEEAVRCHDADAPRAAVVMAVCSLESLSRSFYVSRTQKDSGKLAFWEVIDRVSKIRRLTDAEKGLLNLCRPFRNFAAHPSEYEYSSGEAAGLIHLAAEQVRKWKLQTE